MANLKEIRNRIASINSTMQITGAMKMVSAAKSKKAQDAISAMSSYSNKLTELLQDIGKSVNIENEFMPKPIEKKVLILAITSDRGLCGAFNSNISKKVLSLVEQDFKDYQVSIRTIGKKGNDVLKKTELVEEYYENLFDDLNFEKTEKISSELIQLYKKGTYDRIILVYNSFKNVATQIVKQETFLPIERKIKEQETLSNVDYIWEPSKQEILESLIPKSLKIQFYKALRDSLAAEHGARMTAMHKATDNAMELSSKLKLTYNKARQTAITNEIIEIVGGASAL